MKYLADTHVLIWALEDNPQLSESAKRILLSDENTIFYSFINVWEVAIKHQLHQKDIPFSSNEFDAFCRRAGYIPFPLSFEHAHALRTLYYDKDAAPRDHKDPFDRLLLAIAKTEGMGFITHDSLMSFYREPCIVEV